MRKLVSIPLLLASVGLVLCGVFLSISYYRRWQASKVLAVVREIHPGVTTETQARLLLRPFANYKGNSRQEWQTHKERDEYFAITNSLDWVPDRFNFPRTFFTVNFKFLNGLVAQIDIVEMQVDHPGYPHPNSASVSMYSNQLIQLPEDFSGYSEYSRNTGAADEKGNWTGFKCCYARFIRLDERATPEQVERSLNFNLSCMTSYVRCKDDRQILP